MLTSLQQRLLNDFQRHFPLTPRPYLAIAEQLGISEAQVLEILQQMQDDNYISRVGAVIRPNSIGVSMLVAMSVPDEKLDSVAHSISQYPEVNHNYQRDNRYNLWFVVIADNQTHLQQTLRRIELRTGFQAMRLPLLQDYFIDLGFELEFNNGSN